MTTTHMTRDDVERVVREARAEGGRPNLSGAELRWVDLSGADLRGVYLSGADLTGADLYQADLRGVDLCGAYLTDADLHKADLSGADLIGAILRRADLYGANLTDADLTDADLTKVAGIIGLGHTPSGPAHMVPLPNGTWRLDVDCWDGTTTDLRTLIAGDDWPAAIGIKQVRRRPILESLADHADNLAAYRDDWLTAVVEQWGATTKETAR